MSITTVQPKTSKLTGGVIIDVIGRDFVDTQFDQNLLASEFTDVSTTQASATFDATSESVLLHLPEAINQKAAVRYNNLFNESFFLELSFTRNVRSFPLINGAKALGIELVDQANLLNKVRVFVQYDQYKSYILVVETWKNGAIDNREEMAFDHRKIDSLVVKACGKYIHGFVKSGGEFLGFGKTSVVTGESYSAEIFSEAPTTGVGRDSSIQIDNIKLHEMVSFVGYPTEKITWEDRAIRVRTLPGEISFGDVIVSTANGTNFKLEDFARYVVGSGVSTVSKRFDTVQAIYNEFVNPTREKLFSNSDGFKWDEGFLLSESNKNNNLFVPSLWDPTTGNIPRNFFQSGTGPFDALKFKGITKNIANDTEKWYAQIEHGSYFIANVPYYLFSDESVIEYLGELKTEDGRSYQPLLYKPKIGVPIVASSLGEDLETKRIIERTRYQKRGKFTGRILNGVELDTSNPDNIDKTKEEFVVTYNSNNEITNWAIPAESAAQGKYVFQLPRVPLKEFKVRFSRKDIFKTEKTIAKTYGEDVYDAFQYGESVENDGDYAIDFGRGIVEVLLDRNYTDLGVVGFVYDYPAVITFNDDYTADKGTDIVTPTFSDLATLDDLGESNGQPGQKFRLFNFPIVDYSSITVVDQANFKIFIYDEFDNSFDTEWQRVLSLEGYGPTDKVYTVNPEIGIVTFGDGVTGMIPSKYLKVLAAYKPTLKIQFEPESSNDFWSGKTIDLNLTKQNLNSGFLYISRKDLIPSQIKLEFASRNISAFERTDLNATVFTQEGEVVPNASIFFEIVAGGGDLKDEVLFTNPNGQANTIYTPSSRLQDVGIKIDLFEPGADSETKGQEIFSSYGDDNGVPYLSLKANEVIQGDIEEMYLFKILDDGDDFLPYNNETREGGRLVVYNDGTEPIRGDFLAGSIMGFNNQLPQPFDSNAPNYEPNLRGFYIVGKKTIQARAFIDLEDIRIYSDIVNVTVEYSPLQKGTWKLPTPPVDFESSQINTATYISID